MKLSMTTKKFPTPLMGISQIIPKASICVNQQTGNIKFENEESSKKIKKNFGNDIFLLKLFPGKMF